MALSKIQAESMNLADTYAFTGTVSGAGDMKLLQSTSETSGASSIGVTFSTTGYNNFLIQGIDLHQTSTAGGFFLKVSTDSGSNFVNNIHCMCWNTQHNANANINSGGTLQTDGNGGANLLIFDDTGSGKNMFQATLSNPVISGSNPLINGIASCDKTTSNYFQMTQYASVYNTTSAINNITIVHSSGNNIKGNLKIYGLSNA